ncbi:hypothetical protein JCM24511_02009 [Saitozyma sp. JCM 24511]|nr:hypothetical protein JCM24511_02009 [Saitozyma sp. JCM 24511]
MSGPSSAFGKDVPDHGVSKAGGELTERQKMERGLPYLAMGDETLLLDRLRARRLIQKYNQYTWPESGSDYFGPDERRQILADLFGVTLETVKAKPIEIEPPFYCDYGDNIIFKGPFYSNFNLTILDCAKVTFGARVLVGPGVHIYAATHSTELDERQAGYERAYPVEVGDDAWIGGNVVICGPCKIGKGGCFDEVFKLQPPSGGIDVNNYRPLNGDFAS